MKFRSPYAKELETHKYRQRIKNNSYDDDSWKEEIEEYLETRYGTKAVESRTVSTKEGGSESFAGRTAEAGGSNGNLVEKAAQTISKNDGEAKD